MFPNSSDQGIFRLFCFPYAGAGPVVFRNWHERLPAQVEVIGLRYPGRESRLRETPFVSLPPLIENVFAEILPYLNQPFAFFGHSLGGLIAFELTRKLRSEQSPQPKHLFISSRRAAHLPDPFPPLHVLNNAEFVQKIQQRYNGIPDVILKDPELLELFLPILRADFSVLESYQYQPAPVLDIPISAYLGLHDPGISLQDVRDWQEHTRQQISVQAFPGDHFYLQNQRDALVQSIAKDLAAYL